MFATHPPFCFALLTRYKVLMDYRFNPHMEHPKWYSPVDPKAAAKMWAADKRDKTAQSLLANPWYELS